MQSERTLPTLKWSQLSLLLLAFTVLAVMYLFQQFNFLVFFISLWKGSPSIHHPYFVFIFNKTLRLLINDGCCFLLLVVLFKEQKYMRLAFWIFLFELFLLLPLYFVLKLSIEGDSEISSPLLSQLHRLIINPTLMILLIVAFFYQRLKEKKQIS